MRKRLAAVFCLFLAGLSLGGCTKCGWIWEDGARSCHYGTPR
jgi:hypothetical protein